MSEIVVLGAGPAGLGAAYRLARAGRSVEVLERAPRVGGLAASFDVAGLRVDHGSHRLHPTTPAPILATLRELLGDDLQVRPRAGRIRIAGTFVRFPPRPLDLARRLPPRTSARLVLDAATGALRRPRGETFAAVVRSSLGPTLAGRFYEPYAEKLFGVPADRLSAELARRRVGARSGRDLVRRVVRPARERGVFFYPRRGYGQIADALADAAVRAGAQVTTGAEVTRVAAGEDAVDVHTGDGRSRRASQVWSTLPLSLLARLASAPPQVAAAAARLRTRPLTLVYVVLATDRWTSFDAHYFPERDVPMVRVSEPKNYRDSRDDPAGVTVLCAEVPGEHAGGSEIVEALRGSGLPCPDPVAIEVRRVAHAYPVYDLGFAGNLAIVDAWAGSLPRVLTFGRQGLFAHDNTHHALAMAWAAAEAAAGGPVDPRRWHDARRSFLAHVVDD